MENHAVNPFLPQNEYIPDGEPRVFGSRVYLYGSHDRFGGPLFCMESYVCWSAPVHDLSAWRCEGVIYEKTDDPLNRRGLHCLYAPDVVQGPDGRYYLFYALDFLGIMSVAVCDTPAGKYRFHGHIRFADGHTWGTKSGEPFPFDPGVLVDEDKRIYLYSGFATRVPALATRGKRLTNQGGVVLELESDMLTIRQGPTLLFPTQKQGAPADFSNHEFFEASSMRKIGRTYYFLYSSRHNHELCYATAQSPLGPFHFGGTLVSIGDLFLHGNTNEAEATNYLGNTHGSIAEINGEWYVFYHRQTNRHSYSRQACAERLTLGPDGRPAQAETTSCGLNGGPLPGLGRYEARIACNLWSQSGAARYDVRFPRLRLRAHPYFTQDKPHGSPAARQYIANLRHGAVAGFKYFALQGAQSITVQLRGNARGVLLVSTTPQPTSPIAQIPLRLQGGTAWQSVTAPLAPLHGSFPLYFTCQCSGRLDFLAFSLA